MPEGNQNLEKVVPTSKPDSIKPAQLLRKATSSGTRIIVTEGLSDTLTPNIIEEIQSQQASGDFREIAGRPWWTSKYSAEELKKAGLI